MTELLAELVLSRAPVRPEPQCRGGRLSIREMLRNPAEPFLAEGEPVRQALRLTFRLVQDVSTAMHLSGDAAHLRQRPSDPLPAAG